MINSVACDTNSKLSLDARRRRLIFRAWHRGIKEMDLILGRYVDDNVQNLTDSQLNELERLMSFEDRDLYAWITKEVAIPDDINTPLFAKILAHQTQKKSC